MPKLQLYRQLSLLKPAANSTFKTVDQYTVEHTIHSRYTSTSSKIRTSFDLLKSCQDLHAHQRRKLSRCHLNPTVRNSTTNFRFLDLSLVALILNSKSFTVRRSSDPVDTAGGLRADPVGLGLSSSPIPTPDCDVFSDVSAARGPPANPPMPLSVSARRSQGS